MRLRIFICAVLWFASWPLLAATPIKSFAVGSYTEILQQHYGQAFMLVLWSSDCVPCVSELGMLSQVLQHYPAVKLVMISVDGVEANQDVQALLKQHALAAAEQWLFADADPALLRYQIDPGWYGEVPRHYLFSAEHQRTTIAGRPKCEQLLAWFESNADSSSFHHVRAGRSQAAVCQ